MDYDRGRPGQGPTKGCNITDTPIIHHTSHTVARINTNVPDITNACPSRKKSLSKNALIVNFVFRVKKPKLFPQSAGKIIASDGFWRIAKKITGER